ncbi:MAG TPA: hypothetical protein VLF91_00165 [Candidatus Saccharimonadales bacterium]|nr:hypothetical protein [Candidatus Saccharimonadales bacterium]
MRFTPITELPNVNLALPEYVPAEAIGLHEGRLDLLANLGGFASGVTITSYSGEITEYQPTILGVDSQGTALAGSKAVEKKANLSEEDFEEGGTMRLLHSHPPLTIRVNMAEVTDRVQQRRNKLREPGTWAPLLNQAIGHGLRSAAWDHYVRSPQYGELLTNAVSGAITFSYMHLSSAIINMANYNLSRIFIAYLYRTPPREVCWSLFPGVHPDRALLVSGLSRALKVVKKI